jgi:phospholipase C
MKLAAQSLFVLISLGTVLARAQIQYPNPFQHVVVIVQENRTPDNLFQGLLTRPGINPANYDIATSGVNSTGQVIPLTSVPLGNTTI